MDRYDRLGLAGVGRQGETSEAGTCKSPKQERAWFVEGVKEVRLHCTVDGGIPMEGEGGQG